jgi:hypothetical protein
VRADGRIAFSLCVNVQPCMPSTYSGVHVDVGEGYTALELVGYRIRTSEMAQVVLTPTKIIFWSLLTEDEFLGPHSCSKLCNFYS